MDINKILEGSLDEIADNIFNETKNTTDKAKAIQKQRIGENVQYVIDALKKIETDLRGEYGDVADKLSERIASIKDGKDGRNGADGRAGKDGRAGRDGLAGSKGEDGLPGRDGLDGVDGVSVMDASIDFDGSLIISLSNGRVINVGEVVSQDLADKIQVISTMSTNTAIAAITGGTIDGTVIGGTTPAAGTFTTLRATGVATFPAGTVALPSITTSGDTNTGVYFPAADTVGVTNGGVEAMRLDSSGNVLVNQTASYSGYIATSAGWFPRIQISNVSVAGDIGVGIYSWSTYTGDLGGGIGNGGELILAHSNVNTRGAHTAIVDNMVCGRITFNGSNGTAFAPGAYISVASDGQTWAVNDCPARIVFATTADGAGTPTERMRISSSGNVGIGATANASAILDAQSTTKGVRMPNMTTTQKNAIASPAAGLMVFDTTLAKLCVYSGSAWQTITSV